MDEYASLFETVNQFDDRLMVIKGWAITFSLATLTLAIQKRSPQILTVVALSAICFWALEAEMKYHQSSYYPRMRALEITMAELVPAAQAGCFKTRDGNNVTTPLIDWSWEHPERALTDTVCLRDPTGRLAPYFYSHVLLPHALILLLCLAGLWRMRAEVQPTVTPDKSADA